MRWSAAALVAFVALGKVLSPQFLIWLVPLVPLVARPCAGSARRSLLAAALVLTQLWFPSRYWDLALEFDPLAVWLVLARDLVLVGAARRARQGYGRDAHRLDRRSAAVVVALDERALDPDVALGGLEAHRHAGAHPLDREVAP